MYSLLITPLELQALLADDLPLRLFDCSFDLAQPELGQQQYLACHLPRADYAHLDRDLSAPAGSAAAARASGGRHPLPGREAFAHWLGQRGVQPGQQIVVYDRNQSVYASRLWWMLKWCGHEAVAILDGGLAAWQQTGAAVESGRAAPSTPSHYALGAPLAELRSGEQVWQALGRPEQTLLDARARPRYRGEVEPLDPVAGHIPGALNRPFGEHFQSDGRFKTAAQLRLDFEALLGGRQPDTVVHYCGSGVSAIPGLVAMELAGLGRCALYAGSWSEWCNTPGRPVARG